MSNDNLTDTIRNAVQGVQESPSKKGGTAERLVAQVGIIAIICVASTAIVAIVLQAL
jgi:hypothetical protein